MKHTRSKVNNKGFSLVELIVVIAIMSIAVGALSLSVSLITGSEAKKAFQKMEAVIDEARTGSMSHFNETLTIGYKEKDTSYNEASNTVSGTIESDGYYGEMTMYVMKPESTSADPDDMKHPIVSNDSIETSKEVRKLSNGNPEIAIVCENASGEIKYAIADDVSNYIKFEFDRSTGLYKKITVVGSAGTAVIDYDSVARVFNISGGASDVKVYITAQSGMRTYKMQLIGETGKHIRVE